VTFPALAVSYVACVRPPGGRVPTVRRDTTWPALADALTRPPPVRDDVVRGDPKDEKDARAGLLPAWSPATFDPAWRLNVNARDVSALVLDYDDGTPIEQARETWGRWAYALHTSWSHTDAAPRFRVVVPLATPCPAARWPRVWRWAADRAPEIDPACKDASRLYYLPAVASDLSPWHAETGDGDPLDLDPAALPDPAPDTRPRKPAPTRTAHPVRTRRAPLPDDTRLRELGRLLRSDRGAREHLARSLGAEVTGSPPRADRVTCPACGRPSVWWWIEPGPMAGAACKHRHTCGWRGSLADLAWSMT